MKIIGTFLKHYRAFLNIEKKQLLRNFSAVGGQRWSVCRLSKGGSTNDTFVPPPPLRPSYTVWLAH